MKVVRFPAAQIVREKTPAIPSSQKPRRKRNTIEQLIRGLDQAVRIFPEVHGATSEKLERVHPRIAALYLERLRQAEKEAHDIASLFGYSAYWLETARQKGEA